MPEIDAMIAGLESAINRYYAALRVADTLEWRGQLRDHVAWDTRTLGELRRLRTG